MQNQPSTKSIAAQPKFHMVNKLAEDRPDANYAEENQNSEKLMLLGASSRWMAESARLANLSVVAVDLFNDWDTCQAAKTIKIKKISEAIPLASQIKPAAILFGGGLETHRGLIVGLEQVAQLLNIEEQSLNRMRNPDEWCSAFQNEGIRIPKWAHRPPGSNDQLRWLFKVTDSAGGQGVGHWTSESRMASDRPGFWQEFIGGEPSSALFIADNAGCRCLGLFRQLIGVPEFGAMGFRFSGAIGPLPPTTQQANQLAVIARVLERDFSIHGIVGVDLIDTSEALVPVEINPRPTATCELLERATGVSIVGLHCSAFDWPSDNCDANLAARGVANEKYHGKAIVFWRGDDAFVVNQDVFKTFCELRRRKVMADIPQLDSEILPGHPIVTVFADGESQNEVFSQLKDRAKIVYDAAESARTELCGGNVPPG